MVNKGVKPTETTLARGEVLPSELSRVLNEAAEGAKFVFIRFVWRDGHNATTTDVNEIDDPIEDARNLFYVGGRFDYEDSSELTLDLRNSRNPSELTAKGQTARTRQAAIGQTWASIPGRANLTKSWDNYLWAGSVGVVTGAVALVPITAIVTAVAHEPLSALGWSLRIAAMFLAIAVYISVRRLTQHRWVGRLLVLQRKERRADLWTIAAALATVGALVVAVFAWLYPRQ